MGFIVEESPKQVRSELKPQTPEARRDEGRFIWSEWTDYSKAQKGYQPGAPPRTRAVTAADAGA